MKFGIWYGVASWFMVLKALGLIPFSWWWMFVPVFYPSLFDIYMLVLKRIELSFGCSENF